MTAELPEFDRDTFHRAYELLRSRVAVERHAHREDPDRPETVQAMQIVLHLPKDPTPARTALLSAAAQAVVATCLDPRAVTDEDWNRGLTAWYDHLIRKVARRGRNKAWLDAQEVAGVTVTVNGASARAFVPSAVSDVPAPIKKLQISGTDLDKDNEATAPLTPGVPLIALNADLTMTTGKAAAQVGHGSMLLAAGQSEEWAAEWAKAEFRLQVRELPAAVLRELAAREDAVVVRDAGFTEVAPDSATVVAVANPDDVKF